jgi:D-3-phosphoglycerate dehydrogenase
MTVKMKKIVICDALHPIGLKLLQQEKDIEAIDASNVPKDELMSVIEDCDVAITRSSTDVDEKFLQSAKNIKAIVRAGVGVDNVDIDAASKRGVIIMNVPTANTLAAVEMTMCHLLSTARSFTNANNHLKLEKVWKREKWYGVELSGKKLGIIGFGNIGSRVGIRAKAFDMDVITYDPYIPPSKATDVGVSYTKNFDDILSCDFITIHTPKNSETIGMIGKDEIAKMKDGVRLINVARGGLYDEDALYEGIKSGKVAFAGVDVFSYEPANDHKLLELENICVTPHLGANTVESQEKIATAAATQAISAARGVSYPNALNLPIRADEIPPFVNPYLELVQKIGFMSAQIYKSPIVSLKVEAEGEVAKFIDSFLTFALVGALKESMGDNINYVNAEYIAKEKGIALKTDILSNSSGYKNRVIVKLTTDDGVATIEGSVFGENLQRIVAINGFALDIVPQGKMIIFKNKDVPGVIADIGSILKKENINIADFRLGRDNHGLALAVILVDENISKNTLDELRTIKSCIWTNYVVV